MASGKLGPALPETTNKQTKMPLRQRLWRSLLERRHLSRHPLMGDNGTGRVFGKVGHCLCKRLGKLRSRTFSNENSLTEVKKKINLS